MGILGFFKMLWKSRRQEILPLDGRWQISDFDYFMKGNPHDVATMKAVYGAVPKPAPLPEELE